MIVVPDGVQRERMEICRSCEHLRPVIDQCAVCNCFMQVKSRLPGKRCPLGKWERWDRDAPSG